MAANNAGGATVGSRSGIRPGGQQKPDLMMMTGASRREGDDDRS